MAELMTRLAGPGGGRGLAIEIAAAWGAALRAEAKGKSGQAAEHAQEEANKQMRLAASLAADSATPDRPPAEQAEWLVKATKFYLEVTDKKDVQLALGLLDRLAKMPAGDRYTGEAAYLRAAA